MGVGERDIRVRFWYVGHTIYRTTTSIYTYLVHGAVAAASSGESEMGTTFAGKYPLDDADATGVLPESTPPCVIHFYIYIGIYHFQSPTAAASSGPESLLVAFIFYFFFCRLKNRKPNGKI